MANEQQTLVGTPMSDEQKAQVTTGGTRKPIFETMTKGKIVKVETLLRPETQKDDKGVEFKNAYFQISMEVAGQPELVVENFGFKIYQNKTGLNAYIGPKGQAGKLKALLVEYFNLKDNSGLKEIEDTLMGKWVLFKTEDIANPQGETKPKQIIKQFVLDVK